MPFKMSSCFPAAVEREDKEVLPIAGLSLMTPIVDLDPNNSNSKSSDSGGTGSGSTLLTDSMRLQSKPQQGIRKQRRCWSPELHRRFVSALQQLGGSQGR